MIKLKNIVSLNKPEEYAEDSVFVYVRENIKSIIIIDEVFKVERAAFMYNEKRYSKEEYEMEVMKEIKKLTEAVELTQLAMAEFIIGENKAANTCQVATIYAEYSAISQMFANMIEKGIFTIDRVPAQYKDEVLTVLEANKSK